MKKIFVIALCITAGTWSMASAQTGTAPAAAAKTPMPTFTHVEYYSAAQLQSIVDQTLAEMKTTGKSSGGPALSVDAEHQMLTSVRNADGAVEVHKHYVDVIFVVSGEAMLTTGGTVPDLKDTGNPDEPRGTHIVGGDTYHLQAGDIVHIPVNTPHQMVMVPGKSFAAIVVKVKE
jgi:quercetin dioxygenase-like cupin family protein